MNGTNNDKATGRLGWDDWRDKARAAMAALDYSRAADHWRCCAETYTGARLANKRHEFQELADICDDVANRLADVEGRPS
jgi:uncharacterized protein Yka (UPF0111/DUF47 family)